MADLNFAYVAFHGSFQGPESWCPLDAFDVLMLQITFKLLYSIKSATFRISTRLFCIFSQIKPLCGAPRKFEAKIALVFLSQLACVLKLGATSLFCRRVMDSLEPMKYELYTADENVMGFTRLHHQLE